MGESRDGHTCNVHPSIYFVFKRNVTVSVESYYLTGRVYPSITWKDVNLGITESFRSILSVGPWFFSLWRSGQFYECKESTNCRDDNGKLTDYLCWGSSLQLGLHNVRHTYSQFEWNKHAKNIYGSVWSPYQTCLALWKVVFEMLIVEANQFSELEIKMLLK